ncbi:MAG: SRPBCC family protein [Actinomycetota bacterium]
MLIENEFTVEATPEQTWAFLLDVEKVVPCMPGAELTETVDERNWKGKVSIKFGPVGLAFAGTVEMVSRDDAAKKVQLSAKGMEQKGKGAASATVTSWVEPAGANASTVKTQADITMTGAVAQLSRGLLPEVSKRLTAEFADRLKAAMTGAAMPEGAGDNSINALGLGVKAVGGAIAGVFKKKDD